MTVTHVIAPPAPTLADNERRTSAACALLAAEVADRANDAVVCLGPRSAERSLAAMGVSATRVILPRRGIARTAAHGLRASLDRASEVHAWGLPAIESVLRAKPRCPIIAHADDEPSQHLTSIERIARINTYDESDAAAWRAAAGADADVSTSVPHRLPPLDSRDSLRNALGINDDAVVVAALWDPASTFDARRFVFRVGFLELLERPTVAIVPAQARRLAAARRFRSAASLRFRMLISPAPLLSLIPACDALAPLDAEPGMPPPARGATRVLTKFARQSGVPVADAVRSPEPSVISREMAEFMSPLIETIDAAQEDRVQAHRPASPQDASSETNP